MNWEISFIFQKSIVNSIKFFHFLKIEYGLNRGLNEISKFGKKKIVVFKIQESKSNFDEICVSFSDQEFNKIRFKIELEYFTSFINHCYLHNPSILYTFCSFEINGYLIGQINTLNEFKNDEFLKQFPVIYSRVSSSSLPKKEVNLEAQDLFNEFNNDLK